MCFISVEGYNWVEVTVYIKNLVVLCKELKGNLHVSLLLTPSKTEPGFRKIEKIILANKMWNLN